jgi:hypothetical protein
MTSRTANRLNCVEKLEILRNLLQIIKIKSRNS